ncbi:hypothetical protein F511_00174 [Dorcoceras hygrometricum]|nr:hypothetical protein F511_00174 [Dorcoceras hygrometricum]
MQWMKDTKKSLEFKAQQLCWQNKNLSGHAQYQRNNNQLNPLVSVNSSGPAAHGKTTREVLSQTKLNLIGNRETQLAASLRFNQFGLLTTPNWCRNIELDEGFQPRYPYSKLIGPSPTIWKILGLQLTVTMITYQLGPQHCIQPRQCSTTYAFKPAIAPNSSALICTTFARSSALAYDTTYEPHSALTHIDRALSSTGVKIISDPNLTSQTSCTMHSSTDHTNGSGHTSSAHVKTHNTTKKLTQTQVRSHPKIQFRMIYPAYDNQNSPRCSQLAAPNLGTAHNMHSGTTSATGQIMHWPAYAYRTLSAIKAQLTPLSSSHVDQLRSHSSKIAHSPQASACRPAQIAYSLLS